MPCYLHFCLSPPRSAGALCLQIYAQAEECYKALAAQLKGIAGGFLIGSKPCSADAFLYGHLVLHLSGPVTAPELRKAVRFAALHHLPPFTVSRKTSKPKVDAACKQASSSKGPEDLTWYGGIHPCSIRRSAFVPSTTISRPLRVKAHPWLMRPWTREEFLLWLPKYAML